MYNFYVVYYVEVKLLLIILNDNSLITLKIIILTT